MQTSTGWRGRNREMLRSGRPTSLVDPTGLDPSTLENWGRGLSDFWNRMMFGPTAEFVAASDGVHYVNRAQGFAGTLVSALNFGKGASITFSTNLIVSNDIPDVRRIIHEHGHIEQAKELGPLYLPAYVMGWVLVPGIELASVLSGHGLIWDLHTAHLAEWNATNRMGLGNTWR